MKNLSRLFVLVLLASCITISAQDKNNPWAVSLGVNAVDPYPVSDGFPQSDTFFDQFFNVSDHWNILPAISRIAVSNYLDDNFSFTAEGTINRIDNIGELAVDELSYYAIDGIISYSFMELIKSKKIEPMLGVGGGYTWVDDIGAGTLNGRFAFRYWFKEKIGLEVQTTYKHSFEDYLLSHFQHSVGVVFKFGGIDTDGDGIYDKDDACPEVAGLEIFNGCPDTDSDGIEDAKDDCPNLAGLAEFNGCPDTDGDGVSDNNDECPQVAGIKSFMGCPDADNDGVKDSEDNCPNQSGPSANNGCPWPDTDGDGILDKDDKCPNEAGIRAEQGCPKQVPTVEEVEQINVRYTRSILFDSGKTTIKKESLATIDYVYEFLQKYQKAKFIVEGHTDSAGSAKSNQKLSEKRAQAVKDALVSKGVASNRITSTGYGEDKPIASNKTRAGRAENRRVEITLDNNQ